MVADLADGIPSGQVPGPVGHQYATPKHHPNDFVLHGHTLGVVDDVKYHGLTVTSNPRQDTQIAMATAKANSTMAVLRRNVLMSS